MTLPKVGLLIRTGEPILRVTEGFPAGFSRGVSSVTVAAGKDSVVADSTSFSWFDVGRADFVCRRLRWGLLLLVSCELIDRLWVL